MIAQDWIFSNQVSFEEKALRIFEFQREKNPIFQRFCDALGVSSPRKCKEIPLLPIKAFKEAKVITANEVNPDKSLIFRSSGTSAMHRSQHFIADKEIYRESILSGIKHFYELDDYVIWAYTPGYNTNPNSSLVWMLNMLIERESSGLSRFLPLNTPLDQKEIDKVVHSGKKLMVFGAAFGLMDLIEFAKIQLPNQSVILETGGMKTHRRQISKEELHQQLADGFGLPLSNIHSEYGMAELLSQAYARGSLWFKPVSWMDISIRDPQDPLSEMPYGEEGLIGIVDLANLYSCSFILTGDKGIQKEDKEFQVMGRWNPKNLRGCNFLIESD